MPVILWQKYFSLFLILTVTNQLHHMSTWFKRFEPEIFIKYNSGFCVYFLFYGSIKLGISYPDAQLWHHFVCSLEIDKRVISNSEGEGATMVKWEGNLRGKNHHKSSVHRLVGPNWDNPVLDPAAVLHLNNQLYIYNFSLLNPTPTYLGSTLSLSPVLS